QPLTRPGMKALSSTFLLPDAADRGGTEGNTDNQRSAENGATTVFEALRRPQRNTVRRTSNPKAAGSSPAGRARKKAVVEGIYGGLGVSGRAGFRRHFYHSSPRPFYAAHPTSPPWVALARLGALVFRHLEATGPITPDGRVSR